MANKKTDRQKWEKFLAEQGISFAETGYDTYHAKDWPGTTTTLDFHDGPKVHHHYAGVAIHFNEHGEFLGMDISE